MLGSSLIRRAVRFITLDSHQIQKVTEVKGVYLYAYVHFLNVPVPSVQWNGEKFKMHLAKRDTNLVYTYSSSLEHVHSGEFQRHYVARAALLS